MWDVQVAELARRQFNRISRQAVALPRCTDAAIQHRLDARPLVLVEQGVFGIAPLLGHHELLTLAPSEHPALPAIARTPRRSEGRP